MTAQQLREKLKDWAGYTDYETALGKYRTCKLSEEHIDALLSLFEKAMGECMPKQHEHRKDCNYNIGHYCNCGTGDYNQACHDVQASLTKLVGKEGK